MRVLNGHDAALHAGVILEREGVCLWVEGELTEVERGFELRSVLAHATGADLIAPCPFLDRVRIHNSDLVGADIYLILELRAIRLGRLGVLEFVGLEHRLVDLQGVVLGEGVGWG
jgi:hypothetical protein